MPLGKVAHCYLVIELYITESVLLAQLVYADAHGQTFPVYIPLQVLLKVIIISVAFTSSSSQFHVGSTLCAKVVPQVPFKSVLSHLKLMPSNFKIPDLEEKAMSNHPTYCPHDFIYLCLPLSPILREKYPSLSSCSL